MSSARNAGEIAISDFEVQPVSSARNAGEIAISDCEVQPSAELVRVECAECR